MILKFDVNSCIAFIKLRAAESMNQVALFLVEEATKQTLWYVLEVYFALYFFLFRYWLTWVTFFFWSSGKLPEEINDLVFLKFRDLFLMLWFKGITIRLICVMFSDSSIGNPITTCALPSLVVHAESGFSGTASSTWFYS